MEIKFVDEKTFFGYRENGINELRDFQYAHKEDWELYQGHIPIKKFRPFKNAEEFKPHRDKWAISNNDGRTYRVSDYGDEGVAYKGNHGHISYEQAFSKFRFENNSPCGVLEE